MGNERLAGGGEQGSDIEALAHQWLHDLRNLPEFNERTDGSILARIVAAHPDDEVTFFASRQRLRQDRIEATGGQEDIIGHQLNTLRKVFGRNR